MNGAKVPPIIFDRDRQLKVRSRMRRLQQGAHPARYLIADMIEDMRERLTFLRYEPQRALVMGDWTGELASSLAAAGAQVTRVDPVPSDGEAPLDEECPLPYSGIDLIVSMGLLDTVNDLPGALIHLRHALAPGGLVLASFVGAGSLTVLRRIMQTADAERPSARIHPMVNIRAAAELIQRAGWLDPVVDGHRLMVRYSSLGRMVTDLREQGLGNVLTSRAPPLSRNAYARAQSAFADLADDDGRVTETFEIITLSGRGPPRHR